MARGSNIDTNSTSSSPSEERSNRKRLGALELLSEARDKLVADLCDEVLGNREAILDGPVDGMFNFQFQELEDRYSARLHALNSILESLEYRRPRIINRFETFETTRDTLDRDLNALVAKFDQWDIVDIDVTSIGGGQQGGGQPGSGQSGETTDRLLVVVTLTSDELE